MERQIVTLIEKLGGTKPALCGSVASGTETDASDIDLLINIQTEVQSVTKEHQMIRVADMVSGLEALLGRRVDIHVRSWLPARQAREFAKAKRVPLGNNADPN